MIFKFRGVGMNVGGMLYTNLNSTLRDVSIDTHIARYYQNMEEKNHISYLPVRHLIFLIFLEISNKQVQKCSNHLLIFRYAHLPIFADFFFKLGHCAAYGGCKKNYFSRSWRKDDFLLYLPSIRGGSHENNF